MRTNRNLRQKDARCIEDVDVGRVGVAVDALLAHELGVVAADRCGGACRVSGDQTRQHAHDSRGNTDTTVFDSNNNNNTLTMCNSSTAHKDNTK